MEEKKTTTNDVVCYECETIFEVTDEERETYYNFKCPSCGRICAGFKNINFNMPSNKPTSEKIGEFKRFKPNMNYLEKTYGDELHKPAESFKKKKR